jgi:hypothetical protein
MRSFVQSSASASIMAPAPVKTPPLVSYTHRKGGPDHHTSPFGCQLTSAAHETHAAPPPSVHPFFDVRNDSLLLSAHARSHVTQAIQKGWADSTLRRYSGTIRQFIRFCDAERVPIHLWFPADEFVLCAFAASSCGRHAGGTPRSRLSALKAWHVAHNVKWNGSARLRFVLNGVRNCAPGSSRRPPRPPVNSRMLSQLVRSLDLSSPLDAAVAACAVTAFWGQCRAGELLPLSPSLTPSSPLPTRSDFRRSVRNTLSYVLRLPCTKTHRDGQDVVLVDQRDPINPISLLKNHFWVNRIRDDQFLFSYSSVHGPSVLSKQLFLQRCNTIWSALGYPRTIGHCFRIGGTTELLILGTPPDVVKATGRWSSDSFLRYWRSLEETAPRHIRNIHAARRRRRRR